VTRSPVPARDEIEASEVYPRSRRLRNRRLRSHRLENLRLKNRPPLKKVGQGVEQPPNDHRLKKSLAKRALLNDPSAASVDSPFYFLVLGSWFIEIVPK